MYEKRFGLHRKPFQAVQKPTDYFPSAAYRDILPAILNALKSDLGVAVLTGPSGVGKTVTLESFRQSLQPDTQTLFVRGGAVRHAGDLLYALHRHLVKTQPAEQPIDLRVGIQRWDVIERLQRLSAFWGPLTILLDDVHLVEEDVFSELRSLLEEEADGQKLVRLLIAGPIMLEDVLAQPTMGNFSQKIRTHVFLEPLRAAESVDYLAHHVSNAGAELTKLFETPAVEKIVVAADGMPRCLNLLADEALMICEESDHHQVTVDIVNQALKRLMHLPVSWNASGETEDADSADHEYQDPSTSAELATSPESSVIEVHSVVNSVSQGVIEIGGSDTESRQDCVPSDSAPTPVAPPEVDFSDDDQIVDFTKFEPPDLLDGPALVDEALDSDCCDFVADVDHCRDTELLGQISQISDSIDSLQLPDTHDAEFGSAVEISSDEFLAADQSAQDPVQDRAESESVDDADTTLGESATDTVGDTGSLEHHLLLASHGGRTDFDESQLESADDQSSVQNSSDQTDVSNEHLFAAILAESSGEPAVEDLFSEYAAWQPAGQWPPVQTDGSTDLAKFAGIGNASPVFDRFTWSELGRTVTASPRRLRETDEADTVVAEWPPQAAGLAPLMSIPILNIDVEGIDLLPGIDPLKEEAQSATNAGRPRSQESVAIDCVDNDHFRLADPHSEHVVQETSHQNVPHGTINVDLTVTEDVNPQPTFDGELTLQFFEGEASDSTDAPAVDTSQSDADSVAAQPEEPSSEVAALIANAVERFISDAHGAQGTGDVQVTNGSPPPNTGMAADPSDTRGDLNLESSEEVETLAEETESELAEYAPRLLQEARTRVISVLQAQGQLRQAAGAESSAAFASDSQETTEMRPRLMISSLADEPSESESESESESAVDSNEESESPSPRFRDLFTRLRRMKKRSA